jgi:ubiquinone/menaquinone biosynthesis C-methylase UbiE
MTSDAMVDEFDTYARWTADAVAELGDDHALPAACRGSGSPAALDWLADRMSLRRGTRLLDSGAGVGGPAEHVARSHGAVLAEPMEGACRAAARLFDLPVVVADGAALPFADHAFDAVWSLGVLCTVEDKAALLTELARVVVPGGPVGLLVFERRVEQLAEQPEGNTFPSSAELSADLERAGLVLRHDAWVADLPGAPEAWSRAVEEVERVIARDHGDDEGFQVAQQQSELVGRLIGDGLVAGRLLVATTPA